MIWVISSIIDFYNVMGSKKTDFTVGILAQIITVKLLLHKPILQYIVGHKIKLREKLFSTRGV